MKTATKVLTISVAAYNVEKYLAETLDSLLIEDLDLLEVLVVDDGSSDKTAEIAKRYQEKYPGTFKLVSKKNGGYGSTINTAIKKAKGKYFKQLDGDDKYDTKNLQSLCLELKEEDSDVIYSPFVFDNVVSGKKTLSGVNKELMGATSVKDICFDVEFFRMHSLAFKTSLLKKWNITIDEKCFYTDTEYVVLPLVHAETLKMLDYPIYEYKIGNEGQSVSKEGMLKHFADHTKMTNRLIKESKTKEFENCPGRQSLEGYIADVIFREIIVFSLDLFKTSRKSYQAVKKRIEEIRKDQSILLSVAEKNSKSLSAIARFGFPGYLFVKTTRSLRNRIKGN